MKKLLAFSLFISVLSGCESDPFPKDGKIVNGKEPRRRTVAPPYTIDVASTLKFKEGVKRSYKLKFHVPKGTAEHTFVGLPNGMTYDEIEKKLSWKPTYDDANDNSDPMIKVKRIPVEIWLRSSLDQNTAIKKDIIVEVKDTPRDFNAGRSSRTVNVSEGMTLNESVTITNEDFPNGPFRARTEGLPQGIGFNIENNVIKVNFTPDNYFVTVEDDCGYYSCEKKFDNGKIIVTAPDGRELVTDYKLEVEDVRLDPAFSVPSEINQGLDVNFVVSAYDPNAEVEPDIELEFGPRVGDVTFEDVEGAKSVLKQTHKKLVWKNIPVNMRGKNFEFKFRACVYGSRKYKDNCLVKFVKVNIDEQRHLAPLIKRDSWRMGQVEYIGNNKFQSYKIDIIDGNDENRDIESVKIYPKSMRNAISYSAGKIIIRDNKEGLKQFKLVAESIHGIESVEVFTYEVLPKDWSENISLINKFRSAETTKNKTIFKSIDFLNPDFQNIDKRLLSERSTLVIGTDILKDGHHTAIVEKLSKQITNVVISTPLIADLKGDLAKEIKELGIVTRGRFQDVINGQLKDYYFLVGRDIDLNYPRRRVFLNGALTSVSNNPVLLNKKINSSCISSLSISDDNTGLDHLVGVKCQRKNGGFLVINGFEFGDLKVSLDDRKIPREWMKKLMEQK